MFLKYNGFKVWHAESRKCMNAFLCKIYLPLPFVSCSIFNLQYVAANIVNFVLDGWEDIVNVFLLNSL